MRGDDERPDSMFSYVSPEQRIPRDHTLRAIRQLVDDILRGLSRAFDALYAKTGRPSIPPERLLRAQLLQIFYSIRRPAAMGSTRPQLRHVSAARDRSARHAANVGGGSGAVHIDFVSPTIADGTQFDVMFRLVDSLTSPTNELRTGCFTVTVK